MTILDKLPGTVVQQWVKCGKPNCKCARGELHGPYWYRLWKDKWGKKHKHYVRREDLEAVRAACEAYRKQREAIQRALAFGPKVIRLMQLDGADQLTNELSTEEWLDLQAACNTLEDVANDNTIELRWRVRAMGVLVRASFEQQEADRRAKARFEVLKLLYPPAYSADDEDVEDLD